MTGPTRAVTAYHEAGHAVAAVVLGLDVELATIVSTVEPWGHLRGHVVVTVPGRRDLDYYVRRATMTWCGPLAEHRHLGAGVEDIGDEDCRQIFAYGDLSALGLGEAGAFAQWTRTRAMSVLGGHWPAISAAAAALLERDTLTGDEVRQLVAEVEHGATVVPIRPPRPELAVAASTYVAPHVQEVAHGPRRRRCLLSALADDWALAEVVGDTNMAAAVDGLLGELAGGQPPLAASVLPNPLADSDGVSR